MLTARIDDWMNMQSGGAGFARELAKALGQLFLEVVVQSVLGAEEDNAAL